MSEWWTYAPSDFLLFSARTWYRQLALHNAALWPSQTIAPLLALLAAWLAARGRDERGRFAAIVLAGGWLWTGWAFHLGRYASINWAAPWFAAAFIAQALALVALALPGRGLALERPRRPGARVALALFVLVVVGYPAVAPLAGRAWATAETFGTMPDPTALGTIAFLALATSRRRWLLLAVPLAWCAIAALTLHTLGAPEWPLVVALALAGVALALRR